VSVVKMNDYVYLFCVRERQVLIFYSCPKLWHVPVDIQIYIDYCPQRVCVCVRERVRACVRLGVVIRLGSNLPKIYL